MGRRISFHIFGSMYVIDCWPTVLRQKEEIDPLFLRVVMEEALD